MSNTRYTKGYMARSDTNTPTESKTVRKETVKRKPDGTAAKAPGKKGMVPIEEWLRRRGF
jgi:hypothetical protein